MAPALEEESEFHPNPSILPVAMASGHHFRGAPTPFRSPGNVSWKRHPRPPGQKRPRGLQTRDFPGFHPDGREYVRAGCDLKLLCPLGQAVGRPDLALTAVLSLRFWVDLRPAAAGHAVEVAPGGGGRDSAPHRNAFPRQAPRPQSANVLEVRQAHGRRAGRGAWSRAKLLAPAS